MTLSAVCAALLFSITVTAQAQDRVISGAVVAPATLVASATGSRVAGSISGTVVESATQSPVFGALVGFGASGAHVTTDANGRFTVGDLPGELIAIQVRALGYRPVTDTVRIGDRNIRVRLTRVALALDAIVVTGTPGAAASRTVGNAVTRTAVATVLQATPLVNVQEVLATRVPGVMIMPTQGVVGSGSVARIRGVSSLFLSNDPLLYIDGVRIDNNPRAGPTIRGGAQVSRLGDLNPEEIESIEVIKGPAAGTLYGTEASRGVIQILTRRGVPGPPRFTMAIRRGANWFSNPAGRLNWWFYCKVPLPPGVLACPAAGIDSLNPYQKEADSLRPIFRTGQPQAYDVSLSGGSPTVRYYVSAGVTRDEGIVSYDWRNRVATRANLTMLPSDQLDIETSIGIVRNRMRLGQMVTNGTEIGWDPLTQLNWGSAVNINSPLRGFLRTTPEAAAVIENRSAIDRVLGSVQFRHRPWRWLSQRLTLGTDVGDEVSSILFPSDPAGSLGPFASLSEGDKTVNRRRVSLGSFDYVGSATAALGSQLKSTTSAGAQYSEKRVETMEAYGHGFPVGVSVIGGAAQTRSAEDVVENKAAGVFVQHQFGWKNRRFVTAAVRVDNNSAFGANFNFVTYPKVSASWVLNEESIWKVGFIDALKLRAAYGLAGRQPDAFSSERTYQPVSGPGGASILTPQNIGNPDLKPERGEELEVGFDAGLWQDRVSTSFTYYRQLIKDAIVPKVMEPSRGFPGTQLVNVGQVRNRGLEVSVDTRLVERHSLGWELGLSFSTNDSRIVSLGGVPPVALTSVVQAVFVQGQYHMEGYPIAAYFLPLVLSASIDANGNATNILCASSPEPSAPPAPCDGSARQRVYAGRPTPSWDGNVRTSVTLGRNLRLHGMVDFRGGNVMVNSNANNAHQSSLNTRAITERTNPMLLAYLALNNQGVAGSLPRMVLMKGGFAKLRELSLAYTLPSRWTARLGASSATLTVAGRNLAILWREQREIFGFKVVDPEVRNGIDLSGNTNNQLPQLASVVTSLRVTF